MITMTTRRTTAGSESAPKQGYFCLLPGWYNAIARNTFHLLDRLPQPTWRNSYQVPGLFGDSETNYSQPVRKYLQSHFEEGRKSVSKDVLGPMCMPDQAAAQLYWIAKPIQREPLFPKGNGRAAMETWDQKCKENKKRQGFSLTPYPCTMLEFFVSSVPSAFDHSSTAYVLLFGERDVPGLGGLRLPPGDRFTWPEKGDTYHTSLVILQWEPVEGCKEVSRPASFTV
jgi:hypothetical protein